MKTDRFKCPQCGRELDLNTQYCVRCGRRTALLEVEVDETVHIAPGQNRISLVLRNKGPCKVEYEIKCDENLSVLGRGTGSLEGLRDAALELEVKPGAPSEFDAEVYISSNDGNREFWWDENQVRQQKFKFHVRSLQSGRIVSPVRTVILLGTENWQPFIVRNDGDTDAESELEVPVGCQLFVGEKPPAESSGSRSVKVRLGPKEWQRIWVCQEGSGTGQRAEISGLEKPIEIRQLGLRKGKFKPKLVVGIDFGTVNSSVLIREVATDKEVWIDKERFPSLLYVPFDPRENPAIGSDAEEYFGSSSGLLVEGIKTLLRREVESYQGFSVEELLEKYLRVLREKIEKCFQENGWRDRGDVLYVFTLPVLDAGERYKKQRDRMRKAAVAAGFPDDDEVLWFLEEPVAAALFCLRYSEDVFGGNIPEKFAVLDAGGGTTDVCVGRVSVDEHGRWSFDVEKAFSLHSESSEAREFYHKLIYGEGHVPEDQFGGRLLDYEIAYSAEGRDGKNPAVFCNEPWDVLYTEALTSVAVKEFILGLARVKENLSFDTKAVLDLSQEYYLREIFYSRLEEEYSRVLDDRERLGRLFPEGQALFTYDKDIAPKVRDLWEKSGMKEALRKELEEKEGVGIPLVCVGGTNAIPEFRECAEEASGCRVIDPRAYRLTAVIRGAVLAHDAFAKGVLKTPIRVSFTGPSGETRLHDVLGRYTTLESARPFSRFYELSAGERMEAKIEAFLEDRWLNLAYSQYSAVRTESAGLRVEHHEGVLKASWCLQEDENSEETFWEIWV